MAKSKAVVSDPSFLTAALEGLEMQKQRIEEQIRQVKAMLGKGKGPRAASASAPTAAPATRKKRVLSPAARKRIAAAQKKRWADFHKKKATE
jgi:hypothetical protein